MKLERVQEVYADMESLVISLDPNPAARGPQYLQDLISKTRGFLNTTSFFLQEILRERHIEELRLEAAETDFQVQSDELLADDQRVSTLPAIDDRVAMINVLLKDDRREIRSLKREIKNLGHIEKAVRLRHKELDNTMSAIRLQRSIIETELRTGAVYGDESPTSRGWGRGGASVEDPIDAMDDTELQQVWDDQLLDVQGMDEVATTNSDTNIAPAVDLDSLVESVANLGTGSSSDDFLNTLELDSPSNSDAPTTETSSGQKVSASNISEDPDISKFLDNDVDFLDLLEDL